jgi:predicted secreted protein
MLLAAGGIVIAVGLLAVVILEGSPETVVAVDAAVDAHAAPSPDSDSSRTSESQPDPGSFVPPSGEAGAIPSAVASVRRATTDAGAAPVLETSAPDPGAREGGAKPSGPVNLDEGGAGKTVEVAVGQSVVLLLGANPTSGFDWAVMKAPAALGEPAMGFIEGGTSMGAPGKRRLTWTLKSALPAGEHVVQLGYARSFEPGVAPFKTFQFKVRSKQ